MRFVLTMWSSSLWPTTSVVPDSGPAAGPIPNVRATRRQQVVGRAEKTGSTSVRKFVVGLGSLGPPYMLNSDPLQRSRGVNRSLFFIHQAR
jgi:hypothetical protein